MHYVISDIHGNERRFRSVMEQIRLRPEDTLYVLGDVIDRHPGGIRILRKLLAMPNARLLLGNHEYMMLRALGQPYDDYTDDGRALAHWYRNGGKVTHDHFNRLRKTTRARLLEDLRQLPLSLETEVNGVRYRLVHGAAPENYRQEPPYVNANHFAVWKRQEADGPEPEDGILIFGHTPTMHYQDRMPMEVWRSGRRIDIDCGSGYPEDPAEKLSAYGRLACLRLEDGHVFYSLEDRKTE